MPDDNGLCLHFAGLSVAIFHFSVEIQSKILEQTSNEYSNADDAANNYKLSKAALSVRIFRIIV